METTNGLPLFGVGRWLDSPRGRVTVLSLEDSIAGDQPLDYNYELYAEDTGETFEALGWTIAGWGNIADNVIAELDLVNHPAHYTGHPTIEAIDVLEHVQDYRLGTAMKYIWRVVFGGKENNRQDIEKSIWYLNRWLERNDAVSDA